MFVLYLAYTIIQICVVNLNIQKVPGVHAFTNMLIEVLKYHYSPCLPLNQQSLLLPPLDKNPEWNPVRLYRSPSVAAPGEFLGFLKTGQPSHQARHVTSNAVRGRHDHSYEQGDWLGHPFSKISKIFWGRGPSRVQSVLCSSVRIQKPVNKFSGPAHDH